MIQVMSSHWQSCRAVQVVVRQALSSSGHLLAGEASSALQFQHRMASATVDSSQGRGGTESPCSCPVLLALGAGGKRKI